MKRKTKRPHYPVHTNGNKKVTEENEIASELEYLRKQNIELMRLVEKSNLLLVMFPLMVATCLLRRIQKR